MKNLILLFLLGIGIYSCDIEKYISADLGSVVIVDSTAVYGQIRNQYNRLPVSGAGVRVGHSKTTTDENGNYYLPLNYVSDYNRNLRPLYVVSAPGYETISKPIDVYPEPFMINESLVLTKPIIQGPMVKRYISGTEYVFGVVVMDNQGVDDIQSVTLRGVRSITSSSINCPFSLVNKLSPQKGFFESSAECASQLDLQRAMMLFAVDKEGNADTLIIPPRSFKQFMDRKQ